MTSKSNTCSPDSPSSNTSNIPPLGAGKGNQRFSQSGPVPSSGEIGQSPTVCYSSPPGSIPLLSAGKSDQRFRQSVAVSTSGEIPQGQTVSYTSPSGSIPPLSAGEGDQGFNQAWAASSSGSIGQSEPVGYTFPHGSSRFGFTQSVAVSTSGEIPQGQTVSYTSPPGSISPLGAGKGDQGFNQSWAASSSGSIGQSEPVGYTFPHGSSRSGFIHPRGMVEGGINSQQPTEPSSSGDLSVWVKQEHPSPEKGPCLGSPVRPKQNPPGLEISCDSSTTDKDKPLGAEEEYSDSDSSGDAQDASRRLCMVCNDLASGYHYGIASCEACKAFFKRTVQGNLKYKCHGKKNCEVSKKCRKACQSCRYKKCIKMGMMITGVRHDRLRGGRQKYRRKPEEKDFAPAPSSKVAKYKRVEDLIGLLEKIEPANTPGLPPGTQSDLDAKPTMIRVVSMSTRIADKALINTVAWAKQIPGFKRLHLEDQMLLLQENWMEVLVWRICYRSLNDEVGDRAVVTDGVYVTRDLAQQTGTEHSFDLGMTLIGKCRELNMDYQEFLLMKVIIFLNIDSPKLKDKSSLQRLQNTMFDALHHYTNRKNPGEPRRAYRLLTSLPTLDQIASESVEMVARGSAENNIPLEHLHREMVECKTAVMSSYRMAEQQPHSQPGPSVVARITPRPSLPAEFDLVKDASEAAEALANLVPLSSSPPPPSPPSPQSE